MSTNQSTPIRESHASEISGYSAHTPQSDDVSMHGLIDSISAVKIAPIAEPERSSFPISLHQTGKYEADEEDDSAPLSRQKRIQRETVEGSPFILKKKPNDNPTPAQFQGYRQGRPSTIEESPAAAKETSADGIFSTSAAHPLTIIVSGSDEHETGEHQENARRTQLLVGAQEGCLRRPALAPHIHWIDASKIAPPPITDLLRVHEYEYLRHLENKCRQAAGRFSYEQLPYFVAPPGKLDTDTPLVDQSLEAAKRFCGAAIGAVDVLLESHFQQQRHPSSLPTKDNVGGSVFVIGRPPGHHAGPNGCVPSSTFWRAPGMTSSGFCLLNTVAVAAAYARAEYGRAALSRTAFRRPVSSSGDARPTLSPALSRPPRIAIVDIDIHHGNGTEEIVRNLRPHQTYLPLPSSWAPVSKLSYKPWLNEHDADETLFASVHLFQGEDFYPGSGQENPADIAQNNIVNITLTPLNTEANHKHKAALAKTKREDLCRRASNEFREKMTRILFPQLRRFQADILFISAGFDAHFDDFYHFLTEEDIHWVTSEMMSICAQVNPDHYLGVISVLEGGYSLESLYDKPLSDAAASGTAASSTAAGTGAGTRKKRTSNDTKESKDAVAATAVMSPGDSVQTKYAQRYGDGGLVKR